MSKAIFISDSHGCKKYLRYAMKLARENDAKYIFHCGDIGRSCNRWFAKNSSNFLVYLNEGNHDFKCSIKRMDKKYDNITLLEDEIKKIENTYVVSKKLGPSMRMSKKYNKTLDKLLEEVENEENVILFSHYNTRVLKKGLNIHGHKHVNKWWMYVFPAWYCRMKQIKKYFHKKDSYSYNVALRILLVDLDNLNTKYLL